MEGQLGTTSKFGLLTIMQHSATSYSGQVWEKKTFTLITTKASAHLPRSVSSDLMIQIQF